MAKKPTRNPDQMPLFDVPSEWRPVSMLPNLLDVKTIALDTETRDPELREKGPSWFRDGGYIIGVSLAWENEAIYLPICHEGGDNLDKDMVIGWLKDFLSKYTGTLVLMNGFYDLGWLRVTGIKLNPAITLRDVMMQEALLDEHKLRYNLDSLATTYKMPKKDETLLNEAAINYGLDPKADMWRLPARFVGGYAEKDAALTLAVYKKQLPLIQLQKLEKVIQLEHDLIPCLLEMRFRGVRVDVDKAEQLFTRFKTEEDKHTKEIKDFTGRLIDIWSAESCAAAMDMCDLKYPRTPTGKPSFTDEWLTTQDHPIPGHISKARKMYKVAHTYCKGYILDHADKNNRVHAEFHPLRSDDGGTVSGRFSSSNPNLQNIPARDPEMNTLIRGLFLPEVGEHWCAADYSQQEPRLQVHYAAEFGAKKADVAAARYNDDPDTDYHNFVAELSFGKDFDSTQRKKAKTINLGLAYGMSGWKLCQKLGLPIEEYTSYGKTRKKPGPEGQAILDQYYEGVPFIREMSTHYMKIAEQQGEIRTLSGRLCRFSAYGPRGGGKVYSSAEEARKALGPNVEISRAFVHAALNRKIQGGSADMVKIAMRNLWREGLVPLVTIHDEIGISVPNKETAQHVADIMRDCVKLRVPLKVDIDIGPSWGEAKPMTVEEEL